MREIYAQIGVRVGWDIYEQDPPAGLDLSDGLEYSRGIPVTPEAKLLLADAALPNRTQSVRPRIEVYFVSNLHLPIIPGFPNGSAPGPRGYGFVQAGTWDEKYSDSVVMQMGKDATPPLGPHPYMVLAHECGHILENIQPAGEKVHYPYVDPLPNPANIVDTVNLMGAGDRAEAAGATNNTVSDARRLNMEQQDRMRSQRPNLLS
jgi:hypothetical protein